jgi:DNA-binding response OmpR family regulator
MICLIITADDAVYERLARHARSDGDVPRRAAGALAGLELAVEERPRRIVLDMELRAADTLLESLHRRSEMAGVPPVCAAPSLRWCAQSVGSEVMPGMTAPLSTTR